MTSTQTDPLGASELLAALLNRSSIPYSNLNNRSLEHVNITGITSDSRAVRPGHLFIACRGSQVDGHTFISDAIHAGAAATVIQDPSFADMRAPCLQVADTADTLARLCAQYSGLADLQSSGLLSAIGVTGTNGKSTTACMIQHLLQAAGYRTALIGTIRYDLLHRRIPAPWTTPPANELAQLLVEAGRHGARYAVMEVSSHALSQQRCTGVRFDVAVFTNLSGDHLDYHKDRHSYLAAKKRLFDGLDDRSVAVVNGDDEAHVDMVAHTRASVIRYGLDPSADVRASDINCTITGTSFALAVHGRSLDIELPVVGVHNIRNALAAAGVLAAIDVPLDVIARGLAVMSSVPGRLQRADAAQSSFSVFVDYAHTDDALRNVLAALKPLTAGRLWCVFGCGGDRDRTKRPRMAAASADYADAIVVTSDNPRNEEPLTIINHILSGFTPAQRRSVHIEPDRSTAIGLALAAAEPDDVILIAGKGHEDYQIIKDQRLHFDDVEVVQQHLAAAGGSNTCRR